MKAFVGQGSIAAGETAAAHDTTAMNVAVTSVVKSLDTTVLGVQSALVLYSLVMASFVLIGGKLGDVWGRRTTFTIGIGMYGCGALITAFSQDLWMMILGWSLLEGLGSALMIPAIFAIIGTAFPAGKPRVLPGGKTKKPAAEPKATEPPASA
jgi:MFS family permease